MSATFVLTPGRCGTQWLNQQLQSRDNSAWVCHEPLHFDYSPLDNSPSQPLNKNADRLVSHLTSIQNHLQENKHYLECGFPCWRHLGWFKQALGDQVKVIHIHRDPAENAGSLLKLNAFVPPLLPHLPEKQLFHPLAQDAQLPEYAADRWQHLSPFEKALYYWAEVNMQAALYQSVFAPNNWLTIPYSQLFSQVTLKRIAAFANLVWDFRDDALNPVDQFQGIPQSGINPTAIYEHPSILAVASRLGYAYSRRD